jgi:hypothetical protein
MVPVAMVTGAKVDAGGRKPVFLVTRIRLVAITSS